MKRFLVIIHVFKTMMFIICFGGLLFPTVIRAQQYSISGHFTVTIYSGITTGPLTHEFASGSGEDVPVYPHIAFGGELQYGPLLSAFGSNLDMCLELGYGSIATDLTEISPNIPFRRPEV